jgi:hypothetical protein
MKLLTVFSQQIAIGKLLSCSFTISFPNTPYKLSVAVPTDCVERVVIGSSSETFILIPDKLEKYNKDNDIRRHDTIEQLVDQINYMSQLTAEMRLVDMKGHYGIWISVNEADADADADADAVAIMHSATQKK